MTIGNGNLLSSTSWSIIGYSRDSPVEYTVFVHCSFYCLLCLVTLDERNLFSSQVTALNLSSSSTRNQFASVYSREPPFTISRKANRIIVVSRYPWRSLDGMMIRLRLHGQYEQWHVATGSIITRYAKRLLAPLIYSCRYGIFHDSYPWSIGKQAEAVMCNPRLLLLGRYPAYYWYKVRCIEFDVE